MNHGALRDPGPEAQPMNFSPLDLEAQVPVEDVDDADQRPDEADPRHRRELEHRDELHQVHHQDPEEQRGEERHVAVALGAEHRADDLVADGQDGHLAQALRLARDHLRLGERRPEERDDDDDAQDRDQLGLGDVPPADAEQLPEVKVIQPGRGIPAPAENVAALRGGREIAGH